MLPFDVAINFISQFHSWRSESDFTISLFTEGSEGETFWKWFDMQVCNIHVPVVTNNQILLDYFFVIKEYTSSS